MDDQKNQNEAADGRSDLTAVLGADAEREAFEYWVSDRGRWPKSISRLGDGYRLMQTHTKWLAWKARGQWDREQRAKQGG